MCFQVVGLVSYYAYFALHWLIHALEMKGKSSKSDGQKKKKRRGWPIHMCCFLDSRSRRARKYGGGGVVVMGALFVHSKLLYQATFGHTVCFLSPASLCIDLFACVCRARLQREQEELSIDFSPGFTEVYAQWLSQHWDLADGEELSVDVNAEERLMGVWTFPLLGHCVCTCICVAQAGKWSLAAKAASGSARYDTAACVDTHWFLR